MSRIIVHADSSSWALTESASANAAQFPCGSVSNQPITQKVQVTQTLLANGLAYIQKTDHEIQQKKFG